MTNHVNSEGSLSLTVSAYNFIKKQIQECDYAPGQEIFEKQLNDELGYGRTPIREALLKLKNEGLIEVFPRKGMRIKPINKDEVIELYQIRKLLEPAVIQEFKSLYPKDVLLDFEKEFKDEEKNNSDSLECDINFYLLDIRFHSYFIEFTKNQTLISIYKKMMDQQYRLAIYGAKTKISHRQSNFQQHQAIIEAIVTEDNTRIKEALITHINHSLVTLLKTLES